MAICLLPPYDFVSTFPEDYTYLTLRDHLVSINADPQIIEDLDTARRDSDDEGAIQRLERFNMASRAIRMFNNQEISIDTLITFIKLGIVTILSFMKRRSLYPVKQVMSIITYAGGDINQLVANLINPCVRLERIFPISDEIPEWFYDCDKYVLSGLIDPYAFARWLYCFPGHLNLKPQFMAILRYLDYRPPSKIDMLYQPFPSTPYLKKFISTLEEEGFQFKETETTFDYEYFRSAFDSMERLVWKIFPRWLSKPLTLQDVMDHCPIPESAAERVLLVAKIFDQRPMQFDEYGNYTYANSAEKDWDDSYQLRKEIGLVSQYEKGYQKEYC